MKTGVCYYPEHWPEERWAVDAKHMRQLGLQVIRIGEFAWSRLEDKNGNLNFDWLERSIETLHAEGLSIVLGTPTATPPRWMLDRYPDMLAVDANGKIREFGSRRHYCFSFEPYLQECQRIVTLLAKRFGDHPAVIAWQTDNEYGCHETSISYSPHALAAFQAWCEERYGSIESLNEAWGNVFWSMEYDTFKQIGLPTGTVTESNPSHQLAFWRFSSDQIRRFNKAQVDILKQYSKGTDVLHNFMGNFVEFDHHDVSQDLDIATWDNYPLGFLTRDNTNQLDLERFSRTGHPDGSAFHHDLYRGCCNGRWWVMEQQPGPVNWAPYNPSPVSGMVRLWGWEAFAHGAEVMSYFRWRQAPFAQEQTHAGLLLSDASEDIAAVEIAQLNKELETLRQVASSNIQKVTTVNSLSNYVLAQGVESDIAIVFSYAGIAIQDIQSPGGSQFSALTFCQQIYSACRQWGGSIDIVSPDANLDGYKMIILCNSTEDDPALVEKLKTLSESQRCVIVMFPGTGSRNADYRIPISLPPGHFQQLLNLRVTRSESLPPHEKLMATNSDGKSVRCQQWREHIQSDIPSAYQFGDKWGFHYSDGPIHYINAVPEQADLNELMGELLQYAQVNIKDLGPYLRTQRLGPWRLAFNFGIDAVDLLQSLGAIFDFNGDTTLIIGSQILAQGEIALWAVE
jgi:beta-galactosidase